MQKEVALSIIVLIIAGAYFAFNYNAFYLSPLDNEEGGPDACTDTDGGKNYLVKGTACGNNGCFTDDCRGHP